MKILNIHERTYWTSPDQLGELLDSLAGPNDRLWPWESWPAVEFDRGLETGSQGGHGPVRYTVREYLVGRKVLFEFNRSGITAGMSGQHYFEVVDQSDRTTLRHVIDAEAGLRSWLQWIIMIRPLHNALVEDALDKAELAVTGSLKKPFRHNSWTRFLRYLLRKGS